MYLFVATAAVSHVLLVFEEPSKLVAHRLRPCVLGFVMARTAFHVFVLFEEPNERGIEKDLLGLAVSGDVERVAPRAQRREKLVDFGFGPHVTHVVAFLSKLELIR